MEENYNEAFMKRAIELSRHAALVEKSGGVFGAVVVKNGKIIGEGFNQVIKTKDPTWHAEMHAIREACKAINSPHLDGCILYTSAECCPMCLACAYWAHIKHIYYASTTEDALNYGGFADIDILTEVRKNPMERHIQFEEKMREEAVQVWKEFAANPNRLHY